MTDNKYISDVIKLEDVKAWQSLENDILINSDTGTGKTTFILNVLAENYKVLYLCNRRALYKQIERHAHRLDSMLYQVLEKRVQEEGSGKVIDELKSYDFIVIDEAHYFINDSFFNVATRFSYDVLFKQLKDVKKVLITATSEEFTRLKDVEISKTYTIKKDYSNYKFKEFISVEHIADVLKDLLEANDQDRFIIFCRTEKDYIKIAKRLKEKHKIDIRKDSIYFSSVHLRYWQEATYKSDYIKYIERVIYDEDSKDIYTHEYITDLETKYFELNERINTIKAEEIKLKRILKSIQLL